MCAAAFGDEPPEYFLRHFHNDPDADISALFAARDGEKIVSSARVLRRRMYIGGTPVRVGCIAEVCTLPAYRGRGLSTALLRECVAYMEREKLPVSLLFTGHEQAHYERLGWARAPLKWRRGRIPAGVMTKATLVPAGECSLAALRGLYGLWAGERGGAFARENPKHWDGWIAAEWKRPLALMADGAPLAYADVDNGELRDCAWLPWRADSFAALLGAAFAGEELAMPDALWPFPRDNTALSLDDGRMARLNRPFTAGGALIDSQRALAEALGEAIFLTVEDF